jgi:hypothetical protein
METTPKINSAAVFQSFGVVKEILNLRANEKHLVDGIFELFSSHRRLGQLLKDAIKDHVQSIPNQASFLLPSHAMDFFVKAFFEDDIGRRFSLVFFEPLINTLLKDEASVEVALDQFFNNLISFSQFCPL